MRFTILGCGSSMGVPRPDGNFGNCNPNNKKNIRTRCSAIIQGKSLNIIIDTSPDMRQQLINNKITNIDKVLFSHMHADQTHGINDLRVFYLKNRKPVDIYADLPTQKYLNKTFSYCFKRNSREYPATLKMNSVKKDLYFKCEEVNVMMTHIGGYPGKYEKTLIPVIKQKKPNLFVCGHSHILKVMYDKKYETLHMNPGAVGNYGIHKVKTILKFKIEGKVIKDLKVIEFNRM